MRPRFLPYSLAAILILGCAQTKDGSADGVVLTGLDGRKFHQPALSLNTRATLDSSLFVAQRNFETDPSEENYIWLGRRHAYLYEYRKAIDVFTDGLQRYPDSYRLLRHRGHRYITLRDFDNAISDLSKAAALMPEAPLETEPDGAPNRLNIPLSSTQFNVWYHLGLAHYLKGEFDKARRAYEKCMEVSVNDDLLCATADWYYMTLRRMNEDDVSAAVLSRISPDMNIVENDSYHKRLMMYKGLLPADSVLNVDANAEDADLALATQGYGVGNWYLYNGDTEKAQEIFTRVVKGNHFSAFGFIAAEAELNR